MAAADSSRAPGRWADDLSVDNLMIDEVGGPELAVRELPDLPPFPQAGRGVEDEVSAWDVRMGCVRSELSGSNLGALSADIERGHGHDVWLGWEMRVQALALDDSGLQADPQFAACMVNVLERCMASETQPVAWQEQSSRKAKQKLRKSKPPKSVRLQLREERQRHQVASEEVDKERQWHQVASEEADESGLAEQRELASTTSSSSFEGPQCLFGRLEWCGLASD